MIALFLSVGTSCSTTVRTSFVVGSDRKTTSEFRPSSAREAAGTEASPNTTIDTADGGSFLTWD
jgi:hypothetical protein